MTRKPRRPLNHSLVKALRHVPDFASLDDGLLLKVVGASANLFWPAGSYVFEPGSPSEALYILLAGNVRILDGSDGDGVVAEIGPGDYFGELSLLRNSHHTKAAQAIDDCEVMVLPKRSFEALLEADDDVAEQVRTKRAGLEEKEARLS
jgi:CRP/FNR family transcriptional regulator, cyclic AMP receptor protein